MKKLFYISLLAITLFSLASPVHAQENYPVDDGYPIETPTNEPTEDQLIHPTPIPTQSNQDDPPKENDNPDTNREIVQPTQIDQASPHSDSMQDVQAGGEGPIIVIADFMDILALVLTVCTFIGIAIYLLVTKTQEWAISKMKNKNKK